AARRGHLRPAPRAGRAGQPARALLLTAMPGRGDRPGHRASERDTTGGYPLSDKPVTLIVSDLHVGGGPNDPGDDHVYQNEQFRRFIDEAANSDDGRAGRIELFVNGDFLEFAQVRPEVYTLGSAQYWCSEAESVAKLDAILGGHRDIFEALGRFAGRGNRVTMGAGNHDVDLYWADVQKRIGAAAPGVE